MNETVLIVLIVAIAVIVVLYMFRHRLSDFAFKADGEGIETKLSTHQPDAPDPAAPGPAPSPDVVISGNVQRGRDHKIKVRRDNVQVRENLQEGRGQEISAGAGDEGQGAKDET